jgi:hypothetical protein
MLLGRTRGDNNKDVTTRPLAGNTGGGFQIFGWALALAARTRLRTRQLRCLLPLPLPLLDPRAITPALRPPPFLARGTSTVTPAGLPAPPPARRRPAVRTAIARLRP